MQIPLEPPILPSLDELAVSVPDNASFPMTESPPPGYMTDENEPVSKLVLFIDLALFALS